LATRIEWVEPAKADLARLDKATQQRVANALGRLRALDDPSLRLVPYAENLKGFWKLRVGDYRVVCELRTDDNGRMLLVIHVVHRSKAYLARSVRTIKDRANDN
jgi:mRNA interferase RelE/StbE